MDRPAFGIPSFSTDVDLWLEGAWGRWPLRQVGDQFIIADRPGDLPEGRADIVISVDGKEFRHAVRLPEGMTATQTRTPVLPDDGVPF